MSAGAFEHLKALIVEDNPHMRTLLRTLLNALGIKQVFEATNGEDAFAVLRAAAEKLVMLMPPQGRPPALMVALHVWAMTHGIASLFGRGDAARRTLPMQPEELLEAAVLIYLRGLGLNMAAAKRR